MWAILLCSALRCRVVFNYILVVSQPPSLELRHTLVSIWARILSFDPSCQVRTGAQPKSRLSHDTRHTTRLDLSNTDLRRSSGVLYCSDFGCVVVFLFVLFLLLLVPRSPCRLCRCAHGYSAQGGLVVCFDKHRTIVGFPLVLLPVSGLLVQYLHWTSPALHALVLFEDVTAVPSQAPSLWLGGSCAVDP